MLVEQLQSCALPAELRRVDKLDKSRLLDGDGEKNPLILTHGKIQSSAEWLVRLRIIQDPLAALMNPSHGKPLAIAPVYPYARLSMFLDKRSL